MITRPESEHIYENYICDCGEIEEGCYTITEGDDVSIEWVKLSHTAAPAGTVVTVEVCVLEGFRLHDIYAVGVGSVIRCTPVEYTFNGSYAKATFIMPQRM